MSNKETIRRYVLFQIPELTLTIFVLYFIKYFYNYPSWIIWLVVFLSILKDVLMFKFTWKAYAVYKKEDHAGVKGKFCVAKEDIVKKGLVSLNGELWKAQVNNPVKKGESLIIRDVKGLLLIAEKLP
jgi:membrane protein implicated in regulation of membrane protease activity